MTKRKKLALLKQGAKLLDPLLREEAALIPAAEQQRLLFPVFRFPGLTVRQQGSGVLPGPICRGASRRWRRSGS